MPDDKLAKALKAMMENINAMQERLDSSIELVGTDESEKEVEQ